MLTIGELPDRQHPRRPRQAPRDLLICAWIFCTSSRALRNRHQALLARDSFGPGSRGCSERA
eukprot:5540667-Alexandrium_andersonii.AAC.1